ncbi:MAG: LL-diaminopimelate aminotransferase [Candidatus Omnitrophica bacterium]|nr:LL-diaminopimelate aminotransferase [Candidatus Omnitrophota bacterium]MDD5574829.1 LL-diaminopimelate aminotransferase [Candidatus Omnitrophota bacterium]
MDIALSKKLESLPPYLFAEIDAAKRKARAEGRNIIDLGVGDPDIPTPPFVIEKLYEAARDSKNHRYALDQGMPELKEAIADWYRQRFGVALDPVTEILPLIGSKEGIAHLPVAFLNKGDVALVPDPGYPPYRNATILADGKPYAMPLRQSNGFLPDVDAISSAVADKAKLMFLNYPNNPTGAVADSAFFEKVVAFAQAHQVVICHDAAYSEVAFDGFKPVSFLETPGAKEVGVEFHSLSKTYNMTGWRLGWVCGHAAVVAALARVKSNIDSGIFQAIQLAGLAALREGAAVIEQNNKIYGERCQVFTDGLKTLGWKAEKPKASFYVWVKLPKKAKSSVEFARILLERANIVATPGVGFGKYGEGYVRFAMTLDKEKLKEAVERMKVYLVDQF